MLVHPADQAATSRLLSQDGRTMPRDGKSGELCNKQSFEETMEKGEIVIAECFACLRSCSSSAEELLLLWRASRASIEDRLRLLN
jgi:hypothetical protein